MEQQNYRIKSAEFVTSVANLSHYKSHDLPEIAIAGKSNVGKSSLINSMANNRKLAKTSSTPGKTRMINFFRINDDFMLVDLPGYGFSRAGKQRSEQWGPLIEGYLRQSEQLMHMIFLVDIRHAPTAQDKMMCEWLRYYEIPFSLVATKSDKIARAHWPKHMKVIRQTLELEAGFPILPFSVPARKGREELAILLGKVIGWSPEKISLTP